MPVIRSDLSTSTLISNSPFPLNATVNPSRFFWLEYSDNGQVFFGSKTVPNVNSWNWTSFLANPAAILATFIRNSIIIGGGTIGVNTVFNDATLPTFNNNWGVGNSGTIVRMQVGVAYTFPGLTGGPFSNSRPKSFGFAFGSFINVNNPYVDQLSEYLETDGTINILINEYKPIE